MKEFFKYMFASMLGFILTLVILFFLLIALVASLVSMTEQQTVVVEKNTLLQIKLDKPVYDRAPKNPFSFFSPAGFDLEQSPGLDEILKNIEKAKNDPKISGIYLDLLDISAGIATIGEIRDALTDFKASGKFVVAYGEAMSQGAYYLASVADKVYLHPTGLIDFRGFGAELMFLKGTLEKLDVNMQVIRHGNYKSAAEPLMYDKMSEYNREQIQAMIDDAWSFYLDGISASRNISHEELNRIADKLESFDAKKALSLKLVDGLMYKDQILSDLRQRLNIGEKEKIRTLEIGKYSYAEDPDKKKISRDRIAVIYAIGDIIDGKGDDLTVGSKRMSEAIRQARENDKVKAIVLRVNSPGGSALASEVIRREVELAAKEKPTVVSMGELAASGGYWISCSANKIIADPATLTGSIGVFGIIPDLGQFFKNKLGITFDYAGTNENSGFPSVTKPLSPYQVQVIEKEIDGIYSDFLRLVSEGRKMTTEQVDAIGQGRVWSAAAAKKRGLVDELGGLNKAIGVAAEMAGITNYSIWSLPTQKEPLQQILDQLTGEAKTSLIREELGDYYGYYDYLKKLSQAEGIQARLPFEISMK